MPIGGTRTWVPFFETRQSPFFNSSKYASSAWDRPFFQTAATGRKKTRGVEFSPHTRGPFLWNLRRTIVGMGRERRGFIKFNTPLVRGGEKGALPVEALITLIVISRLYL